MGNKQIKLRTAYIRQLADYLIRECNKTGKPVKMRDIYIIIAERLRLSDKHAATDIARALRNSQRAYDYTFETFDIPDYDAIINDADVLNVAAMYNISVRTARKHYNWAMMYKELLTGDKDITNIQACKCVAKAFIVNEPLYVYQKIREVLKYERDYREQ